MMSNTIAARLAVLTAVLGASGAFAQTPGTPASATQATAQGVVKYWLEPPPAPPVGVLERGKWLFRQKGCFLCHGSEGQGGVVNRNYIKDTIPRLNLAEQMKLFEPEDVSAILEVMKRGVRLEVLEDSPPVPQFNVVLAQYHSVRDVIRKGNPAGPKDTRRPAPPLNMPSWGRELSDADIDALIAYLLSAVPGEAPRASPGTPGGYDEGPGASTSKLSSRSLR